MASVALGARIVAAADRTVPVYAAASALVPGERLTPDRLTRVDVALGAASSTYLAAGAALPEGAVAVSYTHLDVYKRQEEVTELGGLYVLGTERHESRRIDNQLRGRSGRQGDPGESRFYLSLQDDLMRMFNAGLVDRFMTSAGMEDSVPIESKLVTRSIQSAQTQVEGRNFDIRKNVLKYDDVMNTQRKVIYAERRRVLDGEDMHDQMRHFITDTIDSYVDLALSLIHI